MQKIFIDACFAGDLQEFYKKWIGNNKGRRQLFNIDLDPYLYTQPVGIEHKRWCPSNICCESGQTLTRENIAIKIGYWTPNLWKPIHKDLLKEAMSSEAYECQKIDMSCNDCISLIRDVLRCKKGKIQSIWANTCCPQNINCFKHRKDGY